MSAARTMEKDIKTKPVDGVFPVNYDADSTEITPEQHEHNRKVFEMIKVGKDVIKVDERAEQARWAFNQDSHRDDQKRTSAADAYGMSYDGFVDVDGYNNPLPADEK